MRRVLHLGLILAVSVFAADLETGKRLFEENKYQEAEQELREAVAAEPDSAEANYYLGADLVQLNKYKEAEPFLEKASAEKPEARVALGHAYMMQDRLNDATRLLNEAAKDQPENAEIHRYQGMILLKQNKFDDAFKQLSKAVELDPKDAYAHYYLAMASSRLKRPDEMVTHFQIFLKLAPDAPEAAKVKSLLRHFRMPRWIWRVALATLAAILALAAMVLIGVHTPPVRSYILGRIQRLASDSGVSLGASALDFNLFTGRVELRDVRLGTEQPQGMRPFLTANRIWLRASVLDLIRGSLSVEDAAVEGLAIDIFDGCSGTE